MWYEEGEDSYGDPYKVVAMYCYVGFALTEFTPENIIGYIANMINGDVEDLGDGWFVVEGDYYASNTPLDKIKGWCESSFTPAGFQLLEDWGETELTDGTPAEECSYFYMNEDGESAVIIQYVVFSWTSGTTEVNSFLAYSYTVEL